MFLVADNILVVRAFAMGAERTVRDNTVGSRGLAARAND